jgi:hypothetical protein
MKRLLLAVLLPLLAADAARAAPVPPEQPPGAAPEIVLARKDGRMVTVEITVVAPVTIVRQVTENVGGMTVTRNVPETRLMPRREMRQYAIEEVRGWTADGKQLDAETLAKRLEKGGPVLLSRDGKPLSAAYRELLKDDALILSLPQQSGPGNPPPPPPPREKQPEPIDK